eukprot:Lankesteria_metandrocarpae@DN3659_c0_g1_i1.p1
MNVHSHSNSSSSAHFTATIGSGCGTSTHPNSCGVCTNITTSDPGSSTAATCSAIEDERWTTSHDHIPQCSTSNKVSSIGDGFENAFIDTELRLVATTIVPRECLVSNSTRFVRFIIRDAGLQRPRLTVTCFFPIGYPNRPLDLQFETKSLPDELIHKLQARSEADVALLAAEGKQQVVPVWRTLYNLFSSNLLILCTDEINKIKEQHIKDTNSDWLKISEKKGWLRLHIEEGTSGLEFKVQVPQRYPEDPVTVTCEWSTFPQHLNKLFFEQATSIARRCAQGCSAHLSVLNSDPAKPPDEVIRISTVNEFKHDVKFFKERAEWDAVATNRKLRQQRKLFEKKELALEREKEALQAQIQSVEDANTAASEGSAAANNSNSTSSSATIGTPSLYPVVEYLVKKFVRLLPVANCVVCGTKLAADGSCNAATFNSENPPQRAYCGDWFHKNCLERVMTNPPFGLECPGKCGSQVFHVDWTSNIKALERQWAFREASRREEEDALDLLDLR